MSPLVVIQDEGFVEGLGWLDEKTRAMRLAGGERVGGFRMDEEVMVAGWMGPNR